MHWSLKTPPTTDPVSIDVARRQCRLFDDAESDDVLVQQYLKAATSWVEGYTGRSLITQTWQASVPSFPVRCWLPQAAPLQGITFVKYYDPANVPQTLASTVYTVPAFSEPAELRLADGQTWPATATRDDAVQIEYITGGVESSIPSALVQAVLLLVGHWHEHRETSIVGTIAGELPFAVQALCAPHRLFLRPPEWA